MIRRKFLESIVTTTLSSFAVGKIAMARGSDDDLDLAPGGCVLQGTTSNTSTEIIVLLNGTDSVEFQITNSALERIKIAEEKTIYSPYRCSQLKKIFLENLIPEEIYEFRIYRNQEIIDTRTFSTISIKEKARIAFLSCLNHIKGKKPEHREFWNDLAETKPTLIVLGGDNVYVSSEEHGEPAKNSWDFWVKYFQAWNTLQLFQLPHLIPTVSIWDDHDFGADNGNCLFPFKDVALKTFQQFFGTRKIEGLTILGPGNSSIMALGEYDLYLMDNRTFRTPDGAHVKEETHWGKEQEQWLLSNLKTRKRPCFIVSGSQYFGGYLLDESYEKNHPVNFKYMLGELRKAEVPLVFVSGDRHFTEVMKIEEKQLGYETYEITSSGFHSGNFPVDPWFFFPNKRQIFGDPFHHTYVLVDLPPPRNAKNFDFYTAVFTFGNKKLFGDNFTIEM